MLKVLILSILLKMLIVVLNNFNVFGRVVHGSRVEFCTFRSGQWCRFGGLCGTPVADKSTLVFVFEWL